ncbi:glycosyltransferase family 4 protein [Microbacterium sulfonylureivorans]|uniref:glycosyltransferase family 4 protein n=1 Tax=Microbacterium sulfonylureivorans TaxID=2486854 RepID=UPI000FDB8A4F|nr:glycosyltransferase family 4 protein [Microbacterium sulfonylureivorans]
MIAPESVVWFVVPEGFDDPERVSGGSVYDQRVGAELRRIGWDVRTVETPAGDAGGDPFERVPDGGLVLVDGLVAICAPDAIEAAACRVRVVALVHMAAAAFADVDDGTVEGERRALPHAHRVIVASEWLKDELVRRGLSTPGRLVVARPGSDAAVSAAEGTSSGASLLCVGVVAPHKGQDTLVEALAELGSQTEWTCTFAGSVTSEHDFAARVAAQAAEAGISERITWAGVLSAHELDAAYAGADVLIAPSRTESYGIAVGDALRRGIPVIASRVGGIPEAAHPPDAAILVPPQDRRALGDALRRWIEDPALRATMSTAARRAAPSRTRWTDTARTIHTALAGLS